jgi:hypothetical protein
MLSRISSDRARDTLKNEPSFPSVQSSQVGVAAFSRSQSNEAIKMVQPQSTPNTIDIPLREFYVYALIDPRNGSIFYVGKGKRERILHHAGQVIVEEAFQDCDDSEDNSNVEQPRTEKEQRIAEIKIAGLAVIERVLARFNTADEAYAVESVLIHWVYGRKHEGGMLTNIQAGHNHNHVRRKGNLDQCEHLDVVKQMRSDPGVYGSTELKKLQDKQIPSIAIETVQQLRILLPQRMRHITITEPVVIESGRWVGADVGMDEPDVILRLQFSLQKLTTNLRPSDEGKKAGRQAFVDRVKAIGLEPLGGDRYCWIGDWCGNGLKFDDYHHMIERIAMAYDTLSGSRTQVESQVN